MVYYYSFKINFVVKSLKQAQKMKTSKNVKEDLSKKELIKILTLTPCNKIN